MTAFRPRSTGLGARCASVRLGIGVKDDVAGVAATMRADAERVRKRVKAEVRILEVNQRVTRRSVWYPRRKEWLLAVGEAES